MTNNELILNNRLNFYMQAYNETNSNLEVIEKEKNEFELQIHTNAKSILNDLIPITLDNKDIHAMEKTYHMELDYMVDLHENLREKNIREKCDLEKDSRCTEYLEILINDDMKYVSKMESDEVFAYLIDTNFGTDKFINEPYINLLGKAFQPRHWKFKGVADKKAIEFGFSNFDEMRKLWSDLRVNYNSLKGNKKISDVMDEYNSITLRIKELEHSIENYLDIRRDAVIDSIIERCKVDPKTINDKPPLDEVVIMLEKLDDLKNNIAGLEERKDQIMDNISVVENMISLASQKNLNISPKALKSITFVKDPSIPIEELVGPTEWISLKAALNKKGIKTSSRKNYSIVKTKISNTEKQRLLKKFDVKEGEIFIDPKLKKRK